MTKITITNQKTEPKNCQGLRNILESPGIYKSNLYTTERLVVLKNGKALVIDLRDQSVSPALIESIFWNDHIFTKTDEKITLEFS